MTTLVTGASGFVGRELTRTLVAGGAQVRILARNSSDLTALDGLPVEVVRGDLNDADAVAVATANARVVYHCAGLVADWGRWADFERANVAGVTSLLDAVVKHGMAERFIHVSSTDVYGYPRTVVDESKPMRDVGYPYNRSKIMGEHQVKAFHSHAGLPTTIVRPATIFGPRSYTMTVPMSRLLLDGKMPLLAGGKSGAGLVYVDDLVTMMVEASTNPAAIGQVYNVSDPSNLTWREALFTLADGIGAPRSLRSIPGSVAIAAAYGMEGFSKLLRKRTRPLLTRQIVYTMTHDQGFPIAKAQRELGFAPKVGVKEGLHRSIEWLRSPEGQTALGA